MEDDPKVGGCPCYAGRAPWRRPAMQCPRCHAQTREGLRFCEDCGAAWRPSVHSVDGGYAGQEVLRVMRCACNCSGCTASPRPESYTPKHLAEKILTSKSALEGERKQVTVLFADLKGSMELLADRDPEEARKLLDPVLEHMMEAVHRYEGTVNQVMGDGIMALFGAPSPTRTMPCAPATQPSGCRRPSSGMPRRSIERGGHSPSDPCRPELRRGGGSLHWQRPPHGLHRRWPNHSSGRTHGADGNARLDSDHAGNSQSG